MKTWAPVSLWAQRHLLDVDALSTPEIVAWLDLAAAMRGRRERHEPEPFAQRLQREVVGLAFYEASTRTRVSFELAARAIGATTVDLSAAGSSVEKGESLIDTLRTLERTGVTVIVLRHPAAGAPYLAARSVAARIINAGDGQHAHPTQAILDALTLRDALGSLEGRKIAIVGDIVHSRVARSNLRLLPRLGANVCLAGPPTMVEAFEGWPGVAIAGTLDEALDEADAVMALRIQLEREAAGDLTSIGAYVGPYRLNSRRMRRAKPGAPILHPGPTNEGVELSAELANGPRSLIGRQVTNGVAVRMALLALLAERG
jgi:aspartate carbamoyltransferase catalytic subunit